MIRLQNLLENLSESDGLAVTSLHNPERMVNRAEILTTDTIPDTGTLYLSAGRNTLKSHRLQERILALSEPCLILTDKAQDLPFPLILVREIHDVNQLFTAILQRLRFEEEIQFETTQLYQLLYTGKGLDDIVLRAQNILGRAVSVLDAGYTMLAVSPMMRELPFGVESNDAGDFDFLSAQEVESLRRLNIEQQIYQHTHAFFVQAEDHPDTNWIFCAIRIQHVMSGYVAVCLPDRADASERELRLTSVIADICSVEMQKHDFYAHQTGLQYETFLTDLIEGRFTSLPMIESRFKVLNRHLGKFFCLAILYRSEPHNSELFNERQMSTLRNTYPGSMSVVYKNNIVLLLNQDTPVLLRPDLIRPMAQFALQNQLKVYLSQPFADILKIRIFYEQAQHTLELSDPRSPDQLIYFSTEALPFYLFSKCSYEDLEAGIHHHIFQLQDYDRQYHTEFITTLRAYLTHNRNVTQTAEYLHVHRSTLFYRMKKIEELLEVSLSESHLLFLYELSLQIWDYLSR
ncbi:MAG: helix-turn-helix domain-containing protein [Clostridiales bacterium]|nr:helix-turn-helix domain-containing protein [Clostridiales bacterium]